MAARVGERLHQGRRSDSQRLGRAAQRGRLRGLRERRAGGDRRLSRSSSTWGTRYLQDRLHAERESHAFAEARKQKVTLLIFAVPSLSPKTSAHQNAANDLQARNLASTFVCNHWNEEPPSHRSTSFFQVPVKDGRQFHVGRDASGFDRPYALFDLRKVSN